MSTPQPKPKTSTASVFSIHHLKSEILTKNDVSLSVVHVYCICSMSSFVIKHVFCYPYFVYLFCECILSTRVRGITRSVSTRRWESDGFRCSAQTSS